MGVNPTDWPFYEGGTTVRAAKIETLHCHPPTTTERGWWSAELRGCVRFMLMQDFINTHHPAIGGYLVLYEDGYLSYSPADPFEEGYKLIDGEEKDNPEVREDPADNPAGVDHGRDQEVETAPQ